MTGQEARAAYRIGLERAQAGIDRGGIHRGDWKPTLEEARETNGYSAVAEQLVAQTTGRRWLSTGMVPDGTEPDVDGGIEVRWSAHRTAHLMLWEKDDATRPYVLVTGRGFPLEIQGWCLGTHAKRPQFYKRKGDLLNGTPVRCSAFFVPQGDLIDRTLSLLTLAPGADPDALLLTLANPQTWVQWAGSGAFGLTYDARGNAQ